MKKLFILIFFIFFVSIFIISMLYFVPKEHSSVGVSNINWQQITLKKERLASGKIHYDLRCKKCHGVNGNAVDNKLKLNDDVWHNANGDLQEIYNIIFSGLPSKGMYGWGKKITQTDIINLTLYIKEISKN